MFHKRSQVYPPRTRARRNRAVETVAQARDGRRGQGPAQRGGCSVPRVRVYVRQPRSPLLLPSRPRAQPRDRRITQQIEQPRLSDAEIALEMQASAAVAATCRATMLSHQIGQRQWICHRKTFPRLVLEQAAVSPWPSIGQSRTCLCSSRASCPTPLHSGLL